MRIGLDLDGTVVVYDDLIHREAVAALGMPEDVPPRKTDVRDWIRGTPGGEQRWVELQARVYGPLMAEARPAAGVAELLEGCASAGVAVSIVSHRTPTSVADPSIDLHAAARAWLERSGLALSADHVFLEPTRAQKIARIASEGCVLFVDDLVEVLADAAFPAGTERWLYAPRGHEPADPEVRVFADWAVVLARVLELREAAGAR
ncbi:MAG: haloacid dehalogenase-like hydrolase [Actinobacteria bacterium]|nr:haloacid dehalogenase-like hydrolase [Actinomycetota bacterium]